MNALEKMERSMAPAITKDQIEDHLLKIFRGDNSSEDFLLITKTANEWVEEARSRPIPRMLFGEIWYEGEICILYADTNLGKSILAVQIASCLSSNVPILSLSQNLKEGKKVIYFDFELTDKQFENRASENYKDHFRFSDEFLRVEINSFSEIPDKVNYEEYLLENIEGAIIDSKAEVVIIDNITYLNDELESAKKALPLMKLLKKMNKSLKISALILAHTPKRDMSKPITRNDLSGSKMLMNFCDSAFAIGESSKDKNLRYIKQIKERQKGIVYDSDNVLVCEITKVDSLTQFIFRGYSSEQEHLKQYSDNEKEQRKLAAFEMHKNGFSNVAIGRELGVSEAAVRKWLKQLKND